MFGYIWLILLCCTWRVIQASTTQIDEVVITIDRLGFDTFDCCAYGKCLCSNLALALEGADDNAKIIIESSIPLQRDVEFGNVSSIIITGHDSPTVMCDHQGGLVGTYINQITIENITWDKCNGIAIKDFEYANMTNCTFQYCTNVTLLSQQTGSLNIYNNTFSHNSGSVYVKATSIIIINSFFYVNKANALTILGNSKPSQIIVVFIIGCNFSNNAGNSINFVGCNSGSLFHKQLEIKYSKFNDNNNTVLHVEFCNVTYIKDSDFYNNVAAVSGGAAITAINSTIHITGATMFKDNLAIYKGGAVYLENSHMKCEGSILFQHNSAKYGGAVYVGINSELSAQTDTNLMFADNVAVSYGGAVYVDVDPSNPYQGYLSDRIQLYYDLLLETHCPENNIANKVANCAYFNISSGSCNDASVPLGSNNLFISSLCRMNFSNVTLENFNYTYTQLTVVYEFLLHKLHFDIVISDYFGNLLGPVNVSASCIEYTTPDTAYNYFVDSFTHNITLTNDATLDCYISLDTPLVLDFFAIDNEYWTWAPVEVPTPYVANPCNINIAYIVTDKTRGCVPLNCTYLIANKMDSGLSQLGLQCNKGNDFTGGYYLTTQPGYWYSNGYQQYAVECPIGNCKLSGFDSVISHNYPFKEPYPNSSVQCLSHWTGLVCGECDSVKHSIQYDSTSCIHKQHCLGKSDSITVNLSLLLSISFLYWCLVISLIFVLLHFKFDVTAGYVYGVIFYYSVIEVVINMLIKSRSMHPYPVIIQMLPFLTNLGYLRVPFIKYLRFCLHKAQTMDHVFLGYIHPLIVTCLVVIIYVTSRRFVTVARYIGRYVNSESICLLLLLSYSSMCYTSVQLLKPLAVFEIYDGLWKWRTYLSPTVPYFHGRHILYGIIAILCELIIGIGLPLVILTQRYLIRYLIRYFNLKLISIKPVIDQLQGCYKEEYRWFAAYYLICRQVIYVTDIISDLLSIRSIENNDSQFMNAAITPVFCICVLILVIHFWLQPYKTKGLNILDGCILLTLVFVMVIGTSPNENDFDIVALLLILPLLLLVNYLTLNKKLRHIFIPGSCIAIIAIEVLATWERGRFNPFRSLVDIWSAGVMHFFIILTSFITLITYIIILVLKYIRTRYQIRNYRRLDVFPINGQDDNDSDEDSDSS